MNRAGGGGLQWASKLRPVYTDGDVIASSAMRTNKCEIRCIHNAKGWARGSPPVLTLPHSNLPPVQPGPTSACIPLVNAANQLDTRRNVTFIADVSKNRTPRRQPSGNIADFATNARVGGWHDETRNPLVVNFSECLRINRLTVLDDFYRGEKMTFILETENDIQLLRELNLRKRIILYKEREREREML